MKPPIRKVDANQPDIVKAFRDRGWSVLHMHTLGHGAPDLAVGKNGHTYLVEVKDGMKPPSARKLTSDELKFHSEWMGSIVIIESVQDVIAFDNKRARWYL